MKPKSLVYFSFICLVGSLWSGNPLQASAHGSGVARLMEAPAGPYLVTVWLSPIEVKADEAIHVTVGVQLAGDSGRQPVLDADIQLQVFASGAREPVLTSTATTEQSVNKLLYESDISLIEPGNYAIEVWVDGTAGQGKTRFDIELQPASSDRDWSNITAIALGLLVVIIFARSWLRKHPLSAHESPDNSVTSR